VTPAAERIRPFNLDGSRGRLLAVYYPPTSPQHPLANVLVAPPFAEEMNRCRSMISLQAQTLARIGIGTLVVDPYGTGESDGDSSEATWQIWRDDLIRGVEWLRRHANGCRALWGVRLGAIMASEIAELDPGIERLLYWQPVVEGKTFFTQFLRIRIAAELEESGGVKTTGELRQVAASGGVIEVSGYRISSELARSLDEVRLPQQPKSSASISWFEVLAAADSTVPRASVTLTDKYRAAGVTVQFETVVGPAFWQLYERFVATDLLPATTRALSGVTEPGAERGSTSAAVDIRPESNGPEYPVVFSCEGEHLMGVIHRGTQGQRRGVIIVVAGGPQYRAGAHRQFVALARKLAALGYATLRFDLRGMGDSSGEHYGFEQSEPDIRAAVDTLLKQEPDVREVVLFGECESASGILFYAFRDARVTGIALVNPWVRTEEGRAGVVIKHYYMGRLLSRAFWRKVVSGQFQIGESLRSFVATGRAYLRGRKLIRASKAASGDTDITNLPLPLKTAAGLRRFGGNVMILMSGRDYIAREFDEVVKASEAWRGLLEDRRVLRRDLAGADHTFSREPWQRQASDWVCEWLASW
jgi:exosortase A-associated hydrolase 1/exosortase A-associated hydrolase 2